MTKKILGPINHSYLVVETDGAETAIEWWTGEEAGRKLPLVHVPEGEVYDFKITVPGGEVAVAVEDEYIGWWRI